MTDDVVPLHTRGMAVRAARAGDWKMALRELIATGDRTAAELLLVSDIGTPHHTSVLMSYVEHGAAAALAVLEQPAAQTGDIGVLSLASALARATGDLDRARRLVVRAFEVSRGAKGVTQAIVHRNMALLASYDGDRAVGDVHFHAAEQLAPAGELFALTVSLLRASRALSHECSEEAVAEAEAAIHLARHSGYPSYEPFAMSVGAAAKAQLGQLSDALTEAAISIHLRRILGVACDSAFGQAVLGGVHRRRRECRQAREVLETALAQMPDNHLKADILAELGRVRAADDLPAARALTELAVATSCSSNRDRALLAHAWVAMVSGDTETAAFAAEEARTVATMGSRLATLAEAQELLAFLASDPKAAIGLLDDAGTRYQQVGDRAGRTRVHLTAATVCGARDTRRVRLHEDTLRRHGVRLDPGVADGLTMLARWTPTVAVRSLGGFDVQRHGADVPAGEWQSKKARDLLKILISHRGRPVARQRLMELLWPGQSPSTTGNRLSVLLSTLRRVLHPDRRIEGAGPIVADRTAVAIDLEVVDVDVERFLVLAADATVAHRKGHDDASALLSAAEALYAGEFLPDDPYVDWAIPLRDEAEAAYVGVLRVQSARTTDIDTKVQYLLRILRSDPYDEETHIELVGVLRSAGRHGEARRRQQEYVRLMREIGVRPATESPTSVRAS